MNRISMILCALLLASPTAICAQQNTPVPQAPTGQNVAPTGETAENGANPETAPVQQGKKGSPLDMLLPFALMFAVVYFFLLRPRKKQQQQQKDMLGTMKKHDRVRTIGGIIGTVVDLREDEVVLKIDESSNARMRVVRSAISKVYREDEAK